MDSSTEASHALGAIIRERGVSMGCGKSTHWASSRSHTRTGRASRLSFHAGRSRPPARVAAHQPLTIARRSPSPTGTPPGSGRARRHVQKASRAPSEPAARSQAVDTELSRPE